MGDVSGEPKRMVKLGAVPADPTAVEPERFDYADVWDLEQTTGPERLVVGPSGGQVELMIELARQMPEPFGVLYVLLLSRNGSAKAGRYQSPAGLGRQDVERFLREFAPYFEGDGRHHVWVTSLADYSTLVYDQHNVLYAYGPLARFQGVLEGHGMRRAPVRFPVPHHHCYHWQFDDEETRVLGWWEWQRFDLQPGDDR